MRQIRGAIGATSINPKLRTAAERLQYEGYLRREGTNAAILALLKSGMPIQADRAPDRSQQETGAASDPRRT